MYHLMDDWFVCRYVLLWLFDDIDTFLFVKLFCEFKDIILYISEHLTFKLREKKMWDITWSGPSSSWTFVQFTLFMQGMFSFYITTFYYVYITTIPGTLATIEMNFSSGPTISAKASCIPCSQVIRPSKSKNTKNNKALLSNNVHCAQAEGS